MIKDLFFVIFISNIVRKNLMVCFNFKLNVWIFFLILIKKNVEKNNEYFIFERV